MRTAIIGIGDLGVEIARVLLKAGHTVAVYNRTASKARALEGDGATIAATPREAVLEAEVVLTVVWDDAALEAVTLGPDGILEGLAKEAVDACLSTVSIELAKR
jgi:3-hydroxyisobutyrate dehydrogenase-like beta-hydroxyacid dehydrogenase